jgi:NAD-dependent SIR2 family protein deacetylase
MPANIPAHEALLRLQEGNRRFATDTRNADNLSSLTRRA